MVFNQTKVIPARLEFIKSTGARIELFCLEPAGLTGDFHKAFLQRGTANWKCLVGNLKKWKSGKLYMKVGNNNLRIDISAEILIKKENSCIIRFDWQPAALTFAEVLENLGKVPLPPYLKREPETSDKSRYQTIYAKVEGSVAAPTAGLHFTDNTMNDLKVKGINPYYLTLHVGAGTFQPVISNTVAEHKIHTEFVSVPKNVIEMLREKNDAPLVAVGTTTARTLESLFWFGVRLIREPHTTFNLEQWEPYQNDPNIVSLSESMDAILNYMDGHQLMELNGKTGLIIIPGYKYKVIDLLVTNFHQPKSTLLLLIAAFIGSDWKKAYEFALANDFRFLSYGDSCLFYGSKF